VVLKQTDKAKGKAMKTSLLHKGENHDHTLKGGEFKILTVEDKMFLEVKKTTTLTHIEHKHFKIPPGFYEKTIVQEYDHWTEESRNVID
jgi:hypothetical protein